MVDYYTRIVIVSSCHLLLKICKHSIINQDAQKPLLMIGRIHLLHIEP